MRMDQLPTPCYVVDEDRLEENLKILAGVMEETGCRILLAQKAFSAYGLYPLIGKYLNGTTASGLFEARLGRQASRAPGTQSGDPCIFCGLPGG